MGPSDKFLSLRGSADGLLGLGLMSYPKKIATTGGAGGGATTILELAFRAADGDGMQPLPAGVTSMHGQLYPQTSVQGTVYGDGAGDNGGYVSGNSALNGVDARADGSWSANYHGRGIRVDKPAGTYKVHCCLGANFGSAAAAKMEIWSGGNYPADTANGSTLIATCNSGGTNYVPGTSAVDAAGNAIAKASFFANEQPISFTTSHDHFWLTGTDGLGIDWVRITT